MSLFEHIKKYQDLRVLHLVTKYFSSYLYLASNKSNKVVFGLSYSNNYMNLDLNLGVVSECMNATRFLKTPQFHCAISRCGSQVHASIEPTQYHHNTTRQQLCQLIK